MARKKRNKQNNSSKWSKSVADYLQDKGFLIKNEKLSPTHIKIKNPNLFKK